MYNLRLLKRQFTISAVNISKFFCLWLLCLIPFFSVLSNSANAANVDNVAKVEITSKNLDNSQSLLPSKARYHANINGFELVATQQLHRDKQQWHANQSIISLLGTIEDSARFSIKNGVIIDADYQQSQN